MDVGKVREHAYMDVGSRAMHGAIAEDAEALPTWMAKIVPHNLFAFPPSIAANSKGRYVAPPI